MVSVDKQALISQLCTASKLQGKELEEYRTRLNKMSETELTALISGDKKGDNVDTVELNASQSTAKTEITKKEAEDLSIQNIESNANQAIQMIDSQDDGDISKAYNKLKEKFDSDLAKSNVEKIIYKQLETAYFLKEAQANNLTYKEYYEQRKELLYKTFPGIERFNDKQKDSLKRMIDTLSPEQVQQMQDKVLALPEKGAEGYEDSVRNFLNDFKTETTDSVINSSPEFGMKVQTKPKEKFELTDGERLMSFDEVYYLEQEVEFNKANIQKYNESAAKFAFLSGVNKKREDIHQILQKPLLNIKTRSTTGSESAEMLESEMGIYVNIALEKLYGKDPEKVKAGLEQITNGENLSMQETAQRIMDFVDSNYEKLTGGKKLEDYANEMASDYKSAYGEKDAANLAQSYVQDQEGVVQNIRSGVEFVGMGVMVGGMILFPPAALAGGALASFGGVGVELYNETSKDSVNQERKGELQKELVVNALLMGVGMGAGKAGSSVKALLTAKNAPKLAAVAADIGTDATISLLGDLVLTGQVNLEGEGFSQFMALVAGHRGKIVQGIKHVKENIKAKFGPDARQMPDGTVYKVNKDGSTTVLQEGVNEGAGTLRTATNTGVKSEGVGQSDLSARLDNAQSREDFIAIRDEIKNMPNNAEKLELQKQYLNKWNEFSQDPSRHEIKMEYKGVNEGGEAPRTTTDTPKAGVNDGGEALPATPETPTFKTPEEFESFLKNQTVKDRNSNDAPRFDDYDVEKLVNLSKDNPELVQDLVKERTIDYYGNDVPRFDSYGIEKIVNLSKDNPELVQELLEEKKIDFNGNNVPRFDHYDIERLVNLSKDNPEFVQDLIKERKININGNDVPRFSGNEIEKIVNYSKENPDLVQYLLKERTVDFNGNDVPRFNGDDIETIVNLSKDNPEFVQYLLKERTIDYYGKEVPRFNNYDIENIVIAHKKNPDKVNELLYTKTLDSEGEPTFAFNSGEILDFIQESNHIDLRNKLLSIETQDESGNTYNLLSGDEINNIVYLYQNKPDIVTELINNKKYNIFLKSINYTNIELFTDKNIFKEISDEIPENTINCDISNHYLANQLQVKYTTKNSSKILFIDNNGDNFTISARETTHKQGDNTRVRKEFADGTVLVEEIQNKNVSVGNKTISVPYSLKKTLYDNQGVQTRSEVITPSKDKPESYTINVYERGLNQGMKKKPVGTVQMYGSKNQGSKTVRTVTSEDGSITTHTIIQGPKGSSMTYQIKDKSGNILANIERRHRKIDDNHYTSSFNGQKYDMQFSDDKITVSKTDNDSNIIETIELGSEQLDLNLIDLYKELPGDYLFKIKEMDTKIVLDNSNKTASKGNACFNPESNTIYISSELKNNSFVFAHELGHAIDFHSGMISNNPDLIKVYQEELETYKAATSETESQSIDYFINQQDGTAIPETLAESNALMSGITNKDFDAIMFRGVVLQQHFPKTIAKITELMQTTPVQKNTPVSSGIRLNHLIDAGESEFKHFTREEIETLKKQDKNVKEMSNGDVFRIGDDGSFTKIGTTKAPLKDSSVDLSNVDADKAKVMINDFIKDNKLEDIKDPIIQNKISELQNEILDGKTKKHAMALLNVFKAFKENNIDTNFSQNAVDFITIDNYTKVIDYMKTHKNNFNPDECVAKITKDIVTSNKTTKQLYNRAATLADTPEIQNKFATLIYNTINTTTGDKLASQVDIINKMNDNVLKTYLNSMDKTLFRVDEPLVNVLNNIESEIVEKYVSRYLGMMNQVPAREFTSLILGFKNMPAEIASHIPENIETPILESTILGNKGIIDVFKNTDSKTFDKIPDDVKVELSNKNRVYTDKQHITEALDFIKTQEFEDISNIIKSKFPQINKPQFEAKLKAYFIANNTGNPDNFIEYVKNIDIDELINIAPRVKDFEAEQLLEFLNYHQQKGTELTAENLTYSGSLTKDMQKDLMDYDTLSQILSRFPNTDRRIGHLPQEWMDVIPKDRQKDFANNIYQEINSFVTSDRNDIDIITFQTKLTKLFGEKVEIEQRGTGKYGTGYKITVNGQKPFILKAFHEPPKEFKGYNVHGRTIEPQNAMYAKDRSNDFAGFYFGRAADKFDNDGFMLVEYLPDEPAPVRTKDMSIPKLTSADYDSNQNHNYRSGKIIDYGAMLPVDKTLLEDKGIAKYTRIISSNIIALKGSDTYGFNDARLNIVKNTVQQAENPMQVVEAINIIERNITKNVDSKTLQELKQIKKEAFIKHIKETKPDANPEALFIEYELNNK